jgi:hypothetical protein
MEFAHKPNTKTITNAMLALMENEVPGLRLPGPLPPTDSYFLVSENKMAQNWVKNYSCQLLDR